MPRGFTIVALALIVGLVSACQTPPPSIGKFQRGEGELRILLMPVDIELSEVTAGGLHEPNAEWTQKAKAHFTTALTEKLRSLKARLISYDPNGGPAETAALRQQVINLHGVVGLSVLRHHFLPGGALPHKKGKFDWGLGKSVSSLRTGNDARYALFVFVRDSYVSEGRAAVQVLTAVLTLGRAIPRGGSQLGLASLVDLNSGDIAWFNRVARATGDLRQLAPAKEFVETLMADFPK